MCIFQHHINPPGFSPDQGRPHLESSGSPDASRPTPSRRAVHPAGSTFIHRRGATSPWILRHFSDGNWWSTDDGNPAILQVVVENHQLNDTCYLSEVYPKSCGASNQKGNFFHFGFSIYIYIHIIIYIYRYNHIYIYTNIYIIYTLYI